MGTIASQITSLTIVYSIVIQAQIKENIKAPRHWPLCGEITGTGEFPAQRASNAENVPFDDVIMVYRQTRSYLDRQSGGWQNDVHATDGCLQMGGVADEGTDSVHQLLQK